MTFQARLLAVVVVFQAFSAAGPFATTTRSLSIEHHTKFLRTITAADKSQSKQAQGKRVSENGQ